MLGEYDIIQSVFGMGGERPTESEMERGKNLSPFLCKPYAPRILFHLARGRGFYGGERP